MAGDTTALNTNPAGPGQLTRPAADGYTVSAYARDVGHADALGSDHRVRNRLILVGGFGASRPVAGGRVVLGFGLLVQGGLRGDRRMSTRGRQEFCEAS